MQALLTSDEEADAIVFRPFRIWIILEASLMVLLALAGVLCAVLAEEIWIGPGMLLALLCLSVVVRRVFSAGGRAIIVRGYDLFIQEGLFQIRQRPILQRLSELEVRITQSIPGRLLDYGDLAFYAGDELVFVLPQAGAVRHFLSVYAQLRGAILRQEQRIVSVSRNYPTSRR